MGSRVGLRGQRYGIKGGRERAWNGMKGGCKTV